MLLAWRLLRARICADRGPRRRSALFDDLVSGQPLGQRDAAVDARASWSIDLIERRLVLRDFWQDWLIAAAAIAFCLAGGRFGIARADRARMSIGR